MKSPPFPSFPSLKCVFVRGRERHSLSWNAESGQQARELGQGVDAVWGGRKDHEKTREKGEGGEGGGGEMGGEGRDGDERRGGVEASLPTEARHIKRCRDSLSSIVLINKQ